MNYYVRGDKDTDFFSEPKRIVKIDAIYTNKFCKDLYAKCYPNEKEAIVENQMGSKPLQD